MHERVAVAAADRQSDLLARFDAARLALESWISLAEADESALEARMAARAGPAQSEESWRDCWVVAPLRAAAIYEELRQELTARVAAARIELERVESEIARARARAPGESVAPLERQKAELVEKALTMTARLSTGETSRPECPARLGHLLQRVFRRLACEVFCLVREDLNEAASRARSALTRIDDYERLVREARSLAGPMEVPAFSRADLEAVRRQADLTVVHLQDLAS
jgi:hypothetical protein